MRRALVLLFPKEKERLDVSVHRIITAVVIAAALCTTGIESAPRTKARAGERWVATWATAQQLMPIVRRPPAPPQGGSSSAAGTSGDATNAAPPRAVSSGPPPANMPASFEDETIRMPVRTSIGGRQVRIALSNMLNADPLEVGAAHLAVYAGQGAIDARTDRTLTFSGEASFTVAPGTLALSDPVDLDVAPLADLAVSLYLPRQTGTPTAHTIGMRTSYIAKGNLAGAEAMPPDARTTTAYAWLSSVDVLSERKSFAVVTLGDSITDGFSTTVDANRAWPTLLAKRLAGDKRTRHVAVVNQGISGNQVLRNGAGVSMLARFDRDVLGRPGVGWVVLLGGINDINFRGRMSGPPLTPEELIDGYEQIIARCHAHGIRIVGGTITPQEGQLTATEQGERTRQAVNDWIRTSGRFDAVVDFDKAVRDPARPQRIKAEYDPGDHLHPNDAGNEAMAAAFDLAVFAR